ncbi:MAG: hypothetical protein H7319_08010 [Spirosoma sp.]|nr:hypothetical protein [Spirosoma sp.]
MSTTQIRERFHALIDHISDEDRLKHLYDALADADTVPQEITDELTNAQKQQLETALAQIGTGDALSHQEAKRQIDEWLSR